MPDIRLNLINNSGNGGSTSVVIFRKDEAAPNSFPVAWLVINDLAQGEHYPFTYPAITATEAGLWIGVMPPVEEGTVINSDSLSKVTELSLPDIASADIVITGGGSNNGTYEFTLQNIQFA